MEHIIFFFWDKDSRTRSLKSDPTLCPISTCSFNKEGSLFCFASCYDWSKGYEYYKKDEGSHLLIHVVAKEDIKKS